MLRWRTARKGEKATVYAVVETGGKQVRVEPGQVVEVDRLPVEAGAEIPLGRVLLVVDGDRVVCGTPEVPGARVVAKVVARCGPASSGCGSTSRRSTTADMPVTASLSRGCGWTGLRWRG